MSLLFAVEEIVGKNSGPTLLITAGVHGDEPEGVEAVQQLAGLIQPAKLSGTLRLIAVANESARALHQREGEDGLDLARTCPGRSDGSVTERVALQLSQMITESDAFIDLHTGGSKLRIDPLVGYMLVDSKAVLAKQREMAEAFGLPIVWGTSAKLDGRTLSVARDAGVPAIYAEYLGGRVCSESGVVAYVSGACAVMSYLGMLPEGAQLPLMDKLRVEDTSPQSGHLQISHPSFAKGVFTASVELSDHVQKGDTVGDVDGVNVSAGKSGRVICLRVNGAVEEGESLCVILDK